MKSTGDTDYAYMLESDTLIIHVCTKFWTMDLVPSWLRAIFSIEILPDIERIRHIHFQNT